MVGVKVAALAAAALVAAGSAWAEAETATFVQHVPLGNLVRSPCIGFSEPLFVEGFLEQVIHTTIDDAGGTHLANEVTLQLTGVSGLGGRFILNDAGHREQNLTPGANEFTFVFHMLFIRAGEDVPEDDYYSELVNHVTVNANGEVTSSTFELRTDCQ